MEVASTELNLFVWTEYIPQDHIDCFELVYGVKVNRDEYSANEEMYAKLSAGSTSYDLVQPTDYIVSLMVRQGLLQKLDKSLIPNLRNLDPSVQAQLARMDPGNEYMVNWLWGFTTVGINVEKVKAAPSVTTTIGDALNLTGSPPGACPAATVSEARQNSHDADPAPAYLLLTFRPAWLPHTA